eukprot:353562-Chlamydomonas_euryale.AAC.6
MSTRAHLHRAQRVLDELKYHVVQVARHVGERELGVAVHGHLGRRAVLAQTDRARVVDGVLRGAAGRAGGG